ncbi:hypothetical protein [Paenibacillus glacialis]|uniref:Uncharacterized protein n=1 Tax=Paenibacillus glacialis TaxID=494026 RepID=A0A168KZ19_9BACL|nr:hypothetical protein [Paenibacillus glacialis]OAB42659.1 hypothetical protein PGLA_11710 [Paenibacillus glacialis]
MKFIRILLLISSSVLGVVSYFLILNIIFTIGDRESVFTQRNPIVTVTSILLLLIIIVSYIVLFIRPSKRGNEKFIIINIVVYFFFLISTPYFQTLKLEISHYLKTPSSQAQQDIIKSFGLELKKNQLPYEIDSKLSEKRTHEEIIRHVVILNKNVEGKIKKSEIDAILSKTPNINLKLRIYDKNKQEYVSIIIDEYRNIIYCNPVDFCENND